MNRKTSIDSLVAWWNMLTDEEKSAFPDSHIALKETLARRVAEITMNTFVSHLSDKDAVQLLVAKKGYVLEKAGAIVKSWRRYASEMGYNGPVAWKIKAGFNMATASLAGPCYQNLEFLKRWNFKDVPTVDSLVFWVPHLVEFSWDNTIKRMGESLIEQRHVHGFPEHHCVSFGSIQLLFALVLANFKRTGERLYLDTFHGISDTLGISVDPSNGDYHLTVGRFDSDGLDCDICHDSGHDGVGFFLLGVEKLDQ
jgi:hypothetical protein